MQPACLTKSEMCPQSLRAGHGEPQVASFRLHSPIPKRDSTKMLPLLPRAAHGTEVDLLGLLVKKVSITLDVPGRGVIHQPLPDLLLSSCF